MFFILSKILSVLLSPMTWIFVLLGLAFLYRKKKVVRKYMLGALLIFYFFSNRYISEKVLQFWEINSPPVSQLNDHYNAGIVLGGGLVAIDKSNNQLIYGQSADRIMQAIELYKLHKIEKIIISGGSGSLVGEDFKESVLMKKFLTTIGISPNDILVDSVSRNTYENAIESKKIIEKHFPKGKFLLFTSAFHMRRAEGCFKKQHINFTVFSTNKTIMNKPYTIEYLFLPSSLAIYQWESIIHEWMGMLVYKVMGYI